MTRGGGGVQTPPKKDDIIYEQPLTFSQNKTIKKKHFLYRNKASISRCSEAVIHLQTEME